MLKFVNEPVIWIGPDVWADRFVAVKTESATSETVKLPLVEWVLELSAMVVVEPFFEQPPTISNTAATDRCNPFSPLKLFILITPQTLALRPLSIISFA